MPASRGKALPLLRTINAFLRFLPRTPEGLVFRGRIHQFASSVISIADKSAINLRGDYNDLKTVWEEDQHGAESAETSAKGQEKEGDVDGDVKMETEETKTEGNEISTAEETKSQTGPEPDFYSTLWSLQQYFAHPPSLAPSTSAANSRAPTPSVGESSKTPFATFREKSDLVLPILFEQTKKQKELMGRELDTDRVGTGKKRKRVEGETDGSFFYPRYLTGKRLLEHEVCPLTAYSRLYHADLSKVGRPIIPSTDPGPVFHLVSVPAPPHTRHCLQTSFHRRYAKELRH